MQPTASPMSCPEHFDLDRIAFAVDALTAGFTVALLIHVSQTRGRGTAIVFEALPDDEFHAITVRSRTDDCGETPLRVVGVAAPVRIRTDGASPTHKTPVAPSHGWMVHLVERGGRRATRLRQPEMAGTDLTRTEGARTGVNDSVVPLGGPIDDLCCRLLDMTA